LLFYYIILRYNSSYMFRPIFRLIFEQMQCTIDSAFNLRDLVLQELVKITVVCYIQTNNFQVRYPYCVEYAKI